MGAEFSYEKFQQIYKELSSQKRDDNMLGVKMATNEPVAVLVNNHSYEELLDAFKKMEAKTGKVNDVSSFIQNSLVKLGNIVRVKARRMW